MRFVRFAAVSAAVAASFTVAQASVFSTYNLVVTGNLQNNNQDIEGTALVGGNLSGGVVTVGLRLTPASSYVGQSVLTVGGNITASGVHLQAGNLLRQGTRSGTLDFNGGGSGVQSDIVTNVSSIVSNAASEISSTSSYLRTLSANSSATFPSGQPGPVTFTATPSGPGNIAIFNVSAANVFNNSLIQQFDLSTGGASSIIINVSGTTVNVNNGNFSGNWATPFARANVLWNFYEATTINIDRNFDGAILAPLAHLTNSTAIDGSVFVSSFTQNGEVHLPFYGGFVPAPGAMAMLGLGGLVMTRRRR